MPLQDLNLLPNELLMKIQSDLSDESTAALVQTEKRMYTLFQPQRLGDKFLQRVAYGEQDKAEQLFTRVFSGHSEKIQEALRYRGTFTDYSGRTFNCTAYEYAYWAKDTHMCRMLEAHMDEETKAQMLVRIDAMEADGLSYQQHGDEHRSAHFDLTPFKSAWQAWGDGYFEWYDAGNFDAMETVFLNVGKEQRNFPAHVAQSYYHDFNEMQKIRFQGYQRHQFPPPSAPFNPRTLERVLTFYNDKGVKDSWFPLVSPNSGLGFDFVFMRGEYCAIPIQHTVVHVVGVDLDTLIMKELTTITSLDEVKTADLVLSREHLMPSAISHGMS